MWLFKMEGGNVSFIVLNCQKKMLLVFHYHWDAISVQILKQLDKNKRTAMNGKLFKFHISFKIAFTVKITSKSKSLVILYIFYNHRKSPDTFI